MEVTDPVTDVSNVDLTRRLAVCMIPRVDRDVVKEKRWLKAREWNIGIEVTGG